LRLKLIAFINVRCPCQLPGDNANEEPHERPEADPLQTLADYRQDSEREIQSFHND
jgi:hypothetical protein